MVHFIAVVNSILAGGLAALIVAWTADPAISVVIVVGLVVGLAVLGCHMEIGLRSLTKRGRGWPALFPAL
jgi:hypothetical protein